MGLPSDRRFLALAAYGTPVAFELAPANAPEREVAREMLERVSLDGYTVIWVRQWIESVFCI